MNKRKRLTDLFRPYQAEEKQAKTVERIAVIGHSTEAVGWKPVPYEIPETWAAFKNNFAQDVGNFISTAKPDMYNVHYFDEMIDKHVQLAFCCLEEQRCQHEKSIHNIHIFQDSCKKDIEYRLLQLQKEMNESEDFANE